MGSSKVRRVSWRFPSSFTSRASLTLSIGAESMPILDRINFLADWKVKKCGWSSGQGICLPSKLSRFDSRTPEISRALPVRAARRGPIWRCVFPDIGSESPWPSGLRHQTRIV